MTTPPPTPTAVPTERISSWAEARDQLASLFDRVEDVGDEHVRVRHTHGGRETSVGVRRIEVGGQPWLEFIRLLAALRRVPPTGALAFCSSMPIGAFCVTEGAIALRQVLPLAGLRVSDLADTVQVIGRHGIAKDTDPATDAGG